MSGKGLIIESGLCRCCGGTKRCHVLNVEYEWQGQKEVYSDMFVDCFGLLLSHLDGEPIERAICATCVSRLREAAAFRRQVLSCEEHLLKTRVHVHGDDAVSHINLKEEIEEIKIEIDTMWPPDEPSMLPPLMDDGEDDHMVITTHVIMNDDVADVKVETSGQDNNASNDMDNDDKEDYVPDSQPDTKKWKRPLPLTSLGNKKYRQYTEEELNMALEAVTSKELTIKQAGEKYNVPRKTVAWKIRNINENRETNAALVKENMLKYDDNASDDNDNVDKETEYIIPDPQPDSKKWEWPQAITSLPNKKYRQYTEEELNMALAAVNSKKLSITEAAEKYNVPRQTVSWKIKNINENRETNAAHVKEEMLRYDDNHSNDNDMNNVDKEDDLSDPQPETKKRKRPKALPTSLRNKTYRQYTEDELNMALAAVKSKEMSATEAAEKYNVPRKTLACRIKNINENRETNVDLQRKKISEFVYGIQTILTHTNATPFRNIGNKYYCLFCPGYTPNIEDPKDLRIHTHSKHTDKVKKIEFLMRPSYINEMLRLDVENLTCKCNTKATWPEMLDHLQTKHYVNLEELRSRVVPYRLTTSEMSCALCDYSSGFNNVNTHMNTHYNNHICGHCGDTFVTATRLLCHVKIHRIGKYPCNRCDKMFSRELYRKKHIEVVHMKKLIFKCVHCHERFSSDKLRFVHMESEHKDKLEIKARTCKECDKTFPWGMEYAQHLRRFHALGYTCDECGREFRDRYLLENHKLRHAGVKYECDVCQMPYFSKAGLSKHQKNKHSKPKQSE